MKTPLVALVIVLACACRVCAADAADAVRAMQAGRDGNAAIDSNDFANAVAKLESAVELRPDFPQLHLDLARARVGAGQLDEAVATLERYARLGLHSPIDKLEEFAPLKPRKDFQETAKQVAANLHPKGRGEIAFTLRDVTGLIEGIAWREKTGEYYFGDVHHRAVWLRNKDGTLKRFTPEGDELLGVFGLAVDEANGILWAATAAVPAMRDYAADTAAAALAEIDLASGAIRRTIAIPAAGNAGAAHVLGDLALAEDGTVYLIDTGVPIVWRLRAGGQGLERFAESPEFFALQGIAIPSAGAAVIADQVNGLLRLDLARGTVTRLDAPADSTLIEIKGLAVAPDGRLLAVQTDLRPSRVLAIEFDAAGESVASAAVLESGHIAMGAPALGCIGENGDFYFIGNAGWSRFAESEAKPTPPRQVPIFRTKLPKPKG